MSLTAQLGTLSVKQQEHLRNLLQITVLKMKYDASEYNFSNPGDDEDNFTQFRLALKTVLCNIAQLVRI